MNINLYDFDKTIYDGDSSANFIKSMFFKYPKCLLLIPKIIFAALKYKLHITDKTAMKEVIFSFVKYIPNIDEEVNLFWDNNMGKIKKFYMDKNHENDIIISASPEFLIGPIASRLNVLDMMASRVDKKTGKFDGLNCHGKEKVRRLNEKYTDYKVMESYSDSKVDIPILELAEKAFYVKKDKLIETKFEK